jgi:hypothetical protein
MWDLRHIHVNLNGCELDDYSSIPWTELFLSSLLCWDPARGSPGFISSGYCEFWFERESWWVWSFNNTPTSTTAKQAVRLFATTLLIVHHITIHQLLVNLRFKNESISCEQQRYICSSFNIHDKTHAAEKCTQKVTHKIRAYFYDLHGWCIQFKWQAGTRPWIAAFLE